MTKLTIQPTSNPAASFKAGLVRRAFGMLVLTGAVWPTLQPAQAQGKTNTPIVIQFSHVVTPETAKGQAALRFKALAEARTQERVRVEVYPNSQLYKDREELDALKLGAVQMIAPSLSKLATLGGGDFEVFDLPFLFKDRTEFRAAVASPLGASLFLKLEGSGVKGLAYWDSGFKVFTANRALRATTDFQGQRFRVQASKVLVTQMKTLGATASVSPLTSVYDSLKRGQLDGQENTPINIYTQRLHEVQGHLTISNHGYLAYAVLVNKAFWDKLPTEVRHALEAALQEATTFEYGLAQAENEKALERISAHPGLKVHTLSPTEIQQWRMAVAPVYRAARSTISPETLAALKAVDAPSP